MSSRLSSGLTKLGLGCAASVGLYGLVLGALLTPYLQRFAIYAHNFNTLFYHDVNEPEQFGFAKNQVTPFILPDSDGVKLYAWHILPFDIYTTNQEQIRDEQRPPSPLSVADFETTSAWEYLRESNARVVVSCKCARSDPSISACSLTSLQVHGNAGHIAQGWRPDTQRLLASQPNTHVVTIDYRGFGHSSGEPTEEGLIADGINLLNWVLYQAYIPPERVVVMGQSLGTAVASAVALHFAGPRDAVGLIAQEPHEDDDCGTGLLDSEAFAGIVLVAPFYNLPSLLLTYRIGGLVPLLMPLRAVPYLAALLTSQVVDKWPTAERLALYERTVRESDNFEELSQKNMGSVHLIHAMDDSDISWRQSEMLCQRLLGDGPCANVSEGHGIAENGFTTQPSIRRTVEIVKHGGHNRVTTYASVWIAVMRAFEG